MEETTEDITFDTAQETTTEEILEEESLYEPELIRIDIDEPIPGFEGCYAEGENMYYDYYYWTFYNADGMFIGSQFGFELETPLYYLQDWDGDGRDELICDCCYREDGETHYFIYKNDNGAIKGGYLAPAQVGSIVGSPDITDWDYYEDYDKTNNRIVICFFGDERFYEPLIDDFTFTDGDPTAKFGS